MRSKILSRPAAHGVALLAALGMSLGIARPVQAASPIIMKMGTATLKDGQNEYLIRLAAKINKDSGGRIEAQVYPASQLGPVPREIEALQLGAVAGFIAPSEYLVSLDPRFQVLSAPGLFKNMEQVDPVMKDPTFRKAWFKLGQQRGAQVGAVFLSGPAAIDSRTPIKNVSDLKGMKIRVMASALQMKPLEALGATPVPISLGDVLPALQQGTIDGVLSVLPVLTVFHYYGTAKYFTETDFAQAVSTFVFSRSWLDRLPPDLRKLVQADALSVGDNMNPWILDFYKQERAAWIKGGGTVLRLPPAERAATMAKLRAVGEKVIESEPKLKAMYDITLAASDRVAAEEAKK